MIQMCATCRWYDRIDGTHGRCADAALINQESEPPRITLAHTEATSRCSNWGNANPSTVTRIALRIRHAASR